MTNPNDTAYPADSNTQTESGLTKREYFAAMAMQGILAQMPNVPCGVEKQTKYYAEQYPGLTMFQAVAAESVSMADALIEALNKTK
jgi:Pyruvate/2-oxoacid:ferredoxin oxidoreductase gamma subunit